MEMDKPIGFLESEFERVIATRGVATADQNVVPITEPLRAQATLRERDRRFRELLDALPAAIYTTDTAGRITYYNESAVVLWGHRPTLGTSEWCGSWKLFWPDGTPLPHDQCPMAVALKEDRAVRGMEAACERPDGTRVPFIPYPTPLHDESGKLIGAVNMLVDITERTSETIEEFKNALIGRIGSLAKTHLLLTDEGSTTTFSDILHSELDAFDDGSGKRVRLSGPGVEVPSRLAVSLGMAMHELTTNAAKFGALSVFGGKVDVTWTVVIDAKRRSLNIDWVESGGPPVSAPTRQGFGSRLLEFVLPGQIQAKATIDYRPDGVHVHCAVPMPAETKV